MMAETAEQLVVSIEARMRDFEKNFQMASRIANDNWRSVTRSGEQGAKKLEASFSQATRGVSEKFKLMATSAAGALTAALGANELKKLADDWSAARNKIAAAGEEMDNVAARQSQLADLAITSRSNLGAVVDLYAGLRRSTAELGASQAQVLRVTETISKAFAVSGASSETAAGAITQLNQALAAGALRGDELNSVLEGAPALARLIASEFGVGIGQLKALGEQGKISADRVFTAILSGAGQIDAEFSKTSATINQSITNLMTALQRWVGELDQATGVSAALSGAIGGLAANVNVAAPAFAAALAGFAVGGPIGAGISAATVALVGMGAQIHPIASELATIADYAKAAFDLLKDEAGEVATWFQAQFARAAGAVTAALGAIDASEALAHLMTGVKATANIAIGSFVFAARSIKTAWDTLGVGITETIINAMNGAVAAIEAAVNKIVVSVNSVTSTLNSGIGTSFPTLQSVDMGRIKSTSNTAGEVARQGFNEGMAALKHDYLADLDGALQRLRDGANKAAIDRVFNHPAAKDDGTLDAKLKSSAPKASGGSKTKTKKDTENEFEREIADMERRARAFDMERESVGREAIEVEKAKAAFDLLEAAKKANVAVTPELEQKVDALAGAYATAKVSLDKAKDAQEEWQSGVKAFGDELRAGFESAIIGGERLTKVLDGLLKRLASRLFDRAFDALFSAATGGAGGGLLSGLFPKFASGGLITGPGTGTSDSILAAVSSGEFVVNARATAKNRALLEALNSGHLPRFAAGGFVGAPSMAAPSFTVGQGGPVTVHIPVTVNSSGGDQMQNADLARQVSKQVEQVARGVVCDELRRQMRPGGTVYARYSR
jgi:tape measure domain-containing protein